MIRLPTPEAPADESRSAWMRMFRERWAAALADEPGLAEDLATALGSSAAERFAAAPAEDLRLDAWGVAALRAVGREDLAAAAQDRLPAARRRALATWRRAAERGLAGDAAAWLRSGALSVAAEGSEEVWRLRVPVALRGRPADFALGWTAAIRDAGNLLAALWSGEGGALELSGAAEWARAAGGGRPPRRAAILERCRGLRACCEEVLAGQARRRQWARRPAVRFADLWV